MNENAWRQARDILCVRLDHMGDVLMSTPALRALRQSAPGRRITLLASSGGAAAAGGIAEVDDVIEYEASWMKSSGRQAPAVDLSMAESLRSRAFHAAVIFTTYSQSALPAALLCHLADIPLRLAHCRENPYQLLTNWVRDPEPHDRIRHEVRRQLDLVASVGCQTADERLSFRITGADAAWARRRLRAAGLDPARPWVLLHPGASAASRRYPAMLWMQVACELALRTGYPLVFTGNTQEITLVEEIRKGLAQPSISLAGELDIGKLAAVIAEAPLIVSNNTGPVHLAAAVRTPIVDLYALTNPQHTPWQVPSRVLYHMVPCRNCYQSICPQQHHDCMTKIAPASVVDAALELIEEQSRTRQPAGIQGQKWLERDGAEDPAGTPRQPHEGNDM